MKFSIYAAQSIALPITLSLGHLWTPKRLFVQAFDREGGLRSDVGGRSTITSDGDRRNAIHLSNESPAEGSTRVNLKKNADVGILSESAGLGMSSSPGDSAMRRLQPTCDEGFIDCIDGYTIVDGVTMSCSIACGDECCNEVDACSGLTAKVCKDGKSCTGEESCRNASIGYIVDSCYGEDSCKYVTPGSSSYVVGSCNEFRACYMARNFGNMVNSCNSETGCYFIAKGGSIDDIRGSCNNAFRACKYVAENSGAYGTMEYCCNDISMVCANDGSGNLLSNDSFQACFVPSDQPSLSPSANPSTSLQPSTAPSFQPSAVDRQILTKVNDIDSDIQLISADISGADVGAATCDCDNAEVETIAGDVTVVSQNNAVTRIVLLVTSGGKTTNVDSTPKLFTLDGTSEVEVSVQAATNLSTGVYLILFDSPKKAFWVKFSVGGEEGAALFNTE